MGWLKTLLIIAISLSFASVLDAAELVAMRAYEHKDYHRLTIIISEDIPLTTVKEDERVVLRMRELTPKPLKEQPRTDIIAVKELRSGTDASGTYSDLEVAVPSGSKVVQTVKAGPFRVILDVYPPPGFGSRKKADPHMMAVLLEQDASRVMAFNDSWRWVYRKKVIDMMRQDLYDDSSAEAFSAAGIEAGDRNAVSVEGAKMVMRLKAEGQTQASSLLDAVMHFYSGKSQPVELENALRSSGASAVKGLGYFLLAEHFEKKGFFPEASGYYTLSAAIVEKGPLKALSVFRKARLLFFDHKYSEAKESFKKSFDEGYPKAKLWLANTCIIRGEVDLAWELIGAGRNSSDVTDPVTGLGLADMQLLKGNFQEARFQFASLRSRYGKDGIINSYLLMREADAYFLEGKRDAAIEFYSKTKEKLKGEPWALMALSLADAYYVVGTREALEKAERIFESVALGSYEGSVIVNLRLIATRMVLGRFKEGYDDVKRFHASYPTSPLRQDVNRLSQTLFYGWIDSLVAKGDHMGAVKLHSETPLSIPFGKKAEISLKVAKSYKALGLVRDAASNLDMVIKIGSEPMAEEAMLILANIYLDQKDVGSAERLMKAFSTRFPKTRRAAEKELIYARMAFGNKEYARSAAFNGPSGDPGLAAMKAESLARTGKTREASAAFENVAKMHGERGDDDAAKGAWLRSADARFTTGDFKGAAEAYRKGLQIAGEADRENRSWALYRLAKCYSNLDMKDKEAETLRELKALGGELGQWSEKIFEEAKSL